MDINFKIITFTVLINKKGKNMKPNRKEILENKLRTIVQKIIKEEFRNSDYFKNQLKYFHDVDFIPDS